MRILTETEKNDVKLICDSRGFKVMEWLFTEYQNDILNKYIIWNLDLEDKEILKALNADKNYIKGAKWFIDKIKSAKSWVSWYKINMELPVS